MSRIFILIGLCFLSLFHNLSAKIIEASNLADIRNYLEKLDSESLLLWDVDSTLIIPTDQVLRPGNESIVQELTQRYMGTYASREKWQELVSQILNRTSYDLVDLNAPQIIASLQNKLIPTIAFTAMGTGSFGVIPSMENWRIQQLRNLGIDFSSTFPYYSGLTWQVTSPKLGSPAFKEGVLCSDRLAKGPVLAAFLQKIKWKPNQIIFIDDQFSFLTSVEKAMKALNIPFIGIYYRAVDNLKSPVDMRIAHLQYQVLANEGKWLTDTEAKALLEETSQDQKGFQGAEHLYCH